MGFLFQDYALFPHLTVAENISYGLSGQNKKQILQPYGYQRCDGANTKKTYIMKDNEMNIQIGYYKCANGENYMHLPRRFDAFTSSSWKDDGHGNITTRVSSRFEPDEDSLPYALSLIHI